MYNDTLHPHLPTTNEFLHLYMTCLTSTPSSRLFLIFTILSICVHIPLSGFILHCGLQHWKKPCSSSSSSAPASHSDCLTYHLACLELVGAIGYAIIFSAIFEVERAGLLEVGALLCTYTWLGEMLFHVLMCLEHYLAVVHPILYLKLRKGRWIRIRNVLLALVWLLCFLGLILVKLGFFVPTNFCLVIFSLAVVFFCNFSVLTALMRAGPGKQGGGRQRPDQSKLRAFHTILTILVVLVFRFSWGLFWAVLFVSGGNTDCITMTIDVWFNLPSSLVVPLLFVLRAGKNVCCKTSSQ